jgi:hypothetical protein
MGTPERGAAMGHVPGIHAAKVGKRYLARALGFGAIGAALELEVPGCSPEWSQTLPALLVFEKTLARQRYHMRLSFAATEVVLIEVDRRHGYLTASFPADPEWLTWNNGTLRQLAEHIRTKGGFALLPVLADALEEAGCPDRAVLARCRRPGDNDVSWLVELLATQE